MVDNNLICQYCTGIVDPDEKFCSHCNAPNYNYHEKIEKQKTTMTYGEVIAQMEKFNPAIKKEDITTDDIKEILKPQRITQSIRGGIGNQQIYSYTHKPEIFNRILDLLFGAGLEEDE